MGLAGPSKKRKISHDPNNTKWTRSTGFGHKMLLSQGWSPGTILGPDPNSPHHTIASQVGIKVMLKDDNLGLGCKGNQEDTCTGLGDLQSLLGRLNGKTDESVRSEEDTRRKMWIEGRYGMRFVKGETLESTWVTKELKKGVEEDGKKGSDDDDDDDEEEEEEEDAKESESEDEEEDESETSDGKKEQPKKEKKGKDKDSRNKKRKSSDSEDDEDAGSSSSSSSKDRKSDKSKRKADKALRKAERQAKRERKEAKRQRKDEKRRAKAEKKALKSAIAASSAPSSTASTPPAMPSAEPEPLPKLDKKSKSLPSSLHGSGTSTPVNGRQALRSKWIAQKRMAVMDAKALNEILMIKAA
ncbi:telomerase inhibitor [Orbilia oligospora]|uniref:PinX1-related protein 1 n=1 Tax=Orbilia oligospora TaxID=2813651 RepID=A0A7C8PM00_ORBOL|nr:telomerase inhibitor [Orbilia oligospora]KAF3281746.1 telomerase inhibitor [Orbilia oligospora]TGJ68688.1 telomerase inhibitor [Orbilia oligospora]